MYFKVAKKMHLFLSIAFLAFLESEDKIFLNQDIYIQKYIIFI